MPGFVNSHCEQTGVGGDSWFVKLEFRSKIQEPERADSQIESVDGTRGRDGQKVRVGQAMGPGASAAAWQNMLPFTILTFASNQDACGLLKKAQAAKQGSRKSHRGCG